MLLIFSWVATKIKFVKILANTNSKGLFLRKLYFTKQNYAIYGNKSLCVCDIYRIAGNIGSH